MPVPLLATKMFLPRPGPNQIDRPRLQSRLEAGLLPGSLLTLVCAPAGYGKTTLVSNWISSRSEPGTFAWYSLDPADNNPALFLAYLFAALQKAVPDLQADVQGLLDSPQSIAPQPVLAGLINDLAGYPGPLTLVLDDYQFITAPVIHEAVTFLLDHLPPGLHLLVTTRSDPPFPLHRYRARGQVVEIRADDLRFSPEEAFHFLDASAGVRLGDEELAILDERTEGWIAGLKMAALSLEKQADVPRFIRSLSRSQRYILDYLAEEVLNNQPAEVQQFLLRTSILGRMCAELCEAVMGSGEWGVESGQLGNPATGQPGGDAPNRLIPERPIPLSSLASRSSQSLLEMLERANLFLVPLDDERRWYRYHHLFADLLRVRLRQPHVGLQPGQVAELHRRASAWFEAEGWADEAVQHAVQAGDVDRAARLVERNTVELLARGELHTVLGWVGQLPEEIVQRRPWLSVHQAWTLAFAGKLDEAARLLDGAERQLNDARLVTPADQPRMAYEIQAIRAMLAAMAGIDQTLALEPWLGVEVPEGGLFARSALCWAFGYTCRMRGQLDRAEPAFEEMQRLGRQMDNLWTFVTASVDLGAVLGMRGQLNRAAAVYTEALDRASRRGAYFPGYVGRLESFLAGILCEQNELAKARATIQASIEHNRWWQNQNHDLHACLVRGRIEFAEGNLPAFQEALQQADEILRQGVVVPTLRSQVQAERVRCWLAQGQLDAAVRWADGYAPRLEGPPQPGSAGEPGMVEQLALARVWIAAGRSAQALPLLASLEAAARLSGWVSARIEILALTALAAPDRDQAFKALSEALALAEPEGYRRVFLEEGGDFRLLILDCRLRVEEPRLQNYADMLLSLFPVPAGARTESSDEQPAIKPQKSTMTEPLTARELEVLRCLAEGLTNPKIGARLYISIGTVKAHTASIFRKMDVANRTEAVARAQKWGLI